MFTFYSLFDYLRSLAFLWLCVESFFLSYIYWYGYAKFKQSHIIDSLQKLFLYMGILFGFLAFVALSNVLNKEVHEIITAIIIIFLLPIGYFLGKFRYYSLKEDEIDKELKVKRKYHAK